MALGVTVEPLAGHHDRATFSCGQQELDEWFRRRAGQDEKRNVARVFVAIDRELGVVGAYSLSSYTLALADLTEELAKKLPRYDAMPAALIGRLARDVRVRGQGIGEMLVGDAIRRTLGVERSLAIFAIVVDAKEEQLAEFYRRLGFRPFPSRPFRLFMPTSVAVTALERAS